MIQKSHILLLVRYLKPQLRRVLWMALLLLGGIAFQSAGPQVLRQFIDQVTQQTSAQTLARTALVFLAVAVAGQVVTALGGYLSAMVAWDATNRLRAELALHCLRLDLGFHQARTPGEMLQRIDGDVGVLGNFFSQFVVQMAANGLLALVVLGLLFFEDARAGAALLVYISLAFFLLLRVQKAGGESFDRLRAIQGQAVSFWEEMMTGREDVKPLGGLGYVLARHIGLERAMFPDARLSLVYLRAYVVAFSAVFVMGNALAFAIGAALYGQGLVTLGGVFLLLSYTNLLATRVGIIANQSNDFQEALVAIRRVSELSQAASPLRDGPGADLGPTAPELAFDHVWFAYGGAAAGEQQPQVLRDLSFHLASGQRLGLVGRTGSGKSTIVRLLFRFYDPDQGAVCWNGIDLRQLRLADLRRAVGMVTQDVQIFHATARDNLTLFDQAISDGAIRAALADLGLQPWLDGLADGLDTVLSSEIGLSAGEAQLLALARVFLQDPRVVILDEASSRLDPATEARLARAVDQLLRGRTAIIIAHRLHTLRQVDQLLVIEDGCLVESGQRDALEAAPQSEYNRLRRLELAGAE